MGNLIFCEFDLDTGCVELKFKNGNTISIYCTGVEESMETTIYSRADMDWLIYNDPLSYAMMIFDGTLEDYLRRVSGKHSTQLDTGIYD